ncbi:MAG: translation elongation factor 4 [Patescibacteria group bacterium]
MALNLKNIRNFCIIAHIDHGKSTLADRLLEITGTIEKRLLKPQYLDQLELERERGITIKMAPVRMIYLDHILNLIDTPGHSDFGYEVSRALMAVEGAVLLVDATQGIQAQTLANFENARKTGLKIIGAVNKIDVALAEQIESAVKELSQLLGIASEEILKVSGKTGEGVSELLKRIIQDVPAPKEQPNKASRALIFDSFYDEHKGVLAFIRVISGQFSLNDDICLIATKTKAKTKEIGYFSPTFKPGQKLLTGEIGYIATGIKNPDLLKIGDTLASYMPNFTDIEPLQGYKEPKPVVFVSFYPEDGGEYDNLKQALSKLRLTDASLVFEPDFSEVLGRGFKGGFLGRLHFEITAERLAREFKITTVQSFPSVAYMVRQSSPQVVRPPVGGSPQVVRLPRDSEFKTITNPKDFPSDASEIKEPITKLEILAPSRYLGAILQLKSIFRFSEITTDNFGEKIIITAKLPLADLILDLDDKLKSVSEGFASLNYEIVGYERTEVVKLEILVANQILPGLTRILPKKDIEREARFMVEKLKKLLPRQQFVQAIQAMVGGRIIARETVAAMKKDVTGYLYGGDRTRKMKLWKKQQRGKQKLKEMASKSQIKVPPSVFKELLKK